MKKLSFVVLLTLSLASVAAFTQQTTKKLPTTPPVVTSDTEPSDPDGPVPTCNPNVTHCRF